MQARTMMVLAIGLALAGSVAAAEKVRVRVENKRHPVAVKLIRGDAQCSLDPDARGIDVIGVRDDFHVAMRRQLDRKLVVGEPVSFVFVREPVVGARTGNGILDVFGLRLKFTPEAGREYRIRVQPSAMVVDAIVESREAGSDVAYAPVDAIRSAAQEDLCVDGLRRRGVAAR